MTSPVAFRDGGIAVYEEDFLLQKLAESEKEHAEGGALYAAGGLFDAIRKSFLDVRAMAIRDAATEKLTEGAVSQMAHSDAAYVAFLNGHVLSRTKWIMLDNQRQRHWMKLKIVQSRGYEQRRMG